MAHYRGNPFSLVFPFLPIFLLLSCILPLFSMLINAFHQAAQLAHILNERVKDLAQDVDREGGGY